MKLKTYNIYKAGSTQIGTITASCISKAALHFVATLERPASYEIGSRQHATVRYSDNYGLVDDFVICQA
jgi:hypothetical protein